MSPRIAGRLSVNNLKKIVMIPIICKQNFWKNLIISSRLMLNKLPLSTVSTESSTPQKVKSEDVNWITTYKFPFINFVSALNRVKLYQIGITGLGVPLSFAIESAGHIPEQSSLVFSAIGVSGSLTLIIVGLVAKNLVGILYTDDRIENIKLSYLDFWGKRRDVKFNVKQMNVPDGQSRIKSQLYTTIQLMEQNTTFKLVHRFGGVQDQERFVFLFGE